LSVVGDFAEGNQLQWQFRLIKENELNKLGILTGRHVMRPC